MRNTGSRALAARASAAPEGLRPAVAPKYSLEKSVRGIKTNVKIAVAFLQRLARHLLGLEPDGVVLRHQTALVREPVAQWRGRNRRQDRDDRDAKAVVLDEAELFVEHTLVVVVEADKESSLHDKPGFKDPVERGLDRIASNILDLARLQERFGPSRLNTDEYRAEVRLPHEIHEFRIVAKVDAHLSSATHGIPVPLLPRNHSSQQNLSLDLIADEIVVDEEHVAHAEREQNVEFGKDLPHRLEPWPPSEDYDDVAELGQEWTPPGELDRGGGVAVRPR
jgi:hypothetical protein